MRTNARHANRFATAAAVAVLLAACGTPAQQQYLALGRDTEAVGAAASQCLAAVMATPEWAALAHRVPIDSRAPTLAQLSDPDRATPDEIAPLTVVHARVSACRRQAVDGLARAPGLAAILQRGYAAADNDLVAVMQRRMSWGEANTRARDRAIAMQTAAAAEMQRIAGRLEQQRAAQQAAQAAASRQLIEAAALFTEMGRPSLLPHGAYTLPTRTIECTHAGNRTDCTY